MNARSAEEKEIIDISLKLSYKMIHRFVGGININEITK